MKQWKGIRDILLFVGGLAGVFHETVISTGAERPTLLILFAAMMGLPAFLRQDQSRQDPGKETESSPPDKGS